MAHPTGRTRRLLAAGLAAACVLALGGGVATAGSGGLVQTQCLQDVVLPGATPCPGARVNGLNGATGAATSADGRFVYVASFKGDDVAVFARNTTTGVLTQPASGWCIKDVNAPSTTVCPQTGIGLDGAIGLRISPDGNNVYVASIDSSTVAVLSRNQTTGALSQASGGAGCVRDVNVPSYKAACSQTANGIRAARDVTLSPDGKNLYVAGQASSAISWFSRNVTTGLLTPVSCIEDTHAESLTHCPVIGKGIQGPRGIEASPDGKNVYMTALVGNAVAAFARNATTGALTQLAGSAACIRDVKDSSSGCPVIGPGLSGAFSPTLSRDGTSLYVSGGNGNSIAAFKRDATTGALTQLGGASACIQGESGNDYCPTAGLGLGGADEAVVSPLGDNVYVSGFFGNGFAAFKRDTISGALTQLPGSDSCIENLTAASYTACPVVSNGLNGPRVPVISPDGRQVYVASSVGNTLATFNRAP